MKLVEILARELKEWPEADSKYGTIESMSQATDLQVSHYAGVRQKWRKDLGDWDGSVGDGYVPCSRFKLSELATDHSTAIVTRADWEAEKARIAGKETWLRHRGRKCPVQSGTLVDLRLRGGVIHIGKFCDNHAWIHTGKPFDVMYYRVSETVEQPAPVSEEAIQVGIDAADAGKLTPIAEVKARYAGKAAGPLEWRSRIAEIDKAHASLGSERKTLIDRLASVGLAIAPMA